MASPRASLAPAISHGTPVGLEDHDLGSDRLPVGFERVRDLLQERRSGGICPPYWGELENLWSVLRF